MNVTINDSQRLYVMELESGYSCLGFDVAFKRAEKLAAWANMDGPNPEYIGTTKGFADYERALMAARVVSNFSGKECPVELHPQLIGLEGRRVEVIDADGEKSRFNVGKSTGWLPAHLEIARSNSTGGPAVDSRPFQSVRVIR